MSAELTPDTLFRYAVGVATRAEQAGKSTVWPTLRQCAKRFRTTVAVVEEVADCGIDNGYLGIASAVGVQGLGTAEIEPRGAWLVEAYR